ncbi:MAG: Hpt domain-containing protein [Roseateles sp.]|uniref:hybrid sensor histidine kinase/response regulator n=1 Tax=Roseateles sp. TaxID=1971397 RepID=UPI0039EABF82
MDSALRDTDLPADLSPLAWVQEELRRSLESVHKTLRRLVRDGADPAAGHPGGDVQASAPLLQAAAQLHQVGGVLSLVGLPAGAAVLRAAEAAVEHLARHPQAVEAAAVDTIERADFALLAYIARLLAGGKTSTLALYPGYRELQQLNGAARIHPADLWQHDWSWRTVPLEPGVPARPPESVRAPFEAALLRQMREPGPAHAATLSGLCASLAAALPAGQGRTLWQLAAAVFEGQALKLLGSDAYTKRLGSRLLHELRVLGRAEVSERLAQDLLFFCAQCRIAQGAGPRLAAVHEAWRLTEDEAGDYEDASLGRIDPAWVAQARRRVLAAKESWSSAAEGDEHRLAGLEEQFAALAESLARLFPSGEVLGQTLQRAVVATLRSRAAPPPALAMEVATSLLYVEAALEDAAFDQPEQADRVRRLAGRVEAVAHGQPAEPLEGWMEDLYRRVSDRQTLGSVVHELRASLSEIERQCDEYFRSPTQRELLIPVPGQLQAMRGVLGVLGLDQAAHATLRMRDEVDGLASTEIDFERPGARDVFERLANNLGALGFLIDMLSVQPALAKRMFRFDEASGRLDAVMGRREGAVELPDFEASGFHLDPEPEAEPPHDATQRLQPLHLDLATLDLPDLSLPELAAPAPAADGGPSVADDPEMREIFLDEAGEVIGNARAALDALREAPADHGELTIVRRAFHTLKGSARMVGLNDFGEAAWACEQLYNARLAEPGPQADAALQGLTAEALDHFARWREQIAAGAPGGCTSAPVRQAADALRLHGQWQPAAPADADALAPDALDGLEMVEVVEAAAPPDDALPDLAGLDVEPLPDFADTEVPLVQPDAFAAAPEPGGAPGEAMPHHAATELMPYHAATELLPLAETPADFRLELDLADPPASPAGPEPEPELVSADPDEGFKHIGPLRISIALFNIFLNEADELSRKLSIALAEWAAGLAAQPAVPPSCEVQAHALAGNAGTVGYDDLAGLARELEHALGRAARAVRFQEADAELFIRAADDIRRLLHQFAAGFLKPNDPDVLARLHAYQPEEAPMTAAAPLDASADEPADPDPGPQDAIEPELFPIFEEEGRDLLQDLHAGLRDWLAEPADLGRSGACMRALHTFKGGARLAGAMRLGEQAHRLESAIEALLQSGGADAAQVQALQHDGDALEQAFDALGRSLAPPPPVPAPVLAPAPAPEPPPAAVAEPPPEPQPEPVPAPSPSPSPSPSLDLPAPAPDEAAAPGAVREIDWRRFAGAAEVAAGSENLALGQAQVRVRGSLLERMATQAGEVSIRRARMESELAQMKGGLLDLDDNLERLRTQLRELELQAEAQMHTQQELAQQGGREFDPLEFDRYTRFQELTRMLAESVGDVATLQRALTRSVQAGEDELAAQSRLTRELQDDLLRTRLVEFDSIGERMHRVVRQAARDAGKQVRLEIAGGQTELDRSVLERTAGAFEHLLRNSVAHGIEVPEARAAAGKDAVGTLRIAVSQQGNEVLLDFADDGAGLDLARIRERGLQLGLIAPDAEPDEAQLKRLVFAPGFSTASRVTELSGRGVGMDVVRAEVGTLGGSIEIASTAGQGTSFLLRLPLTTALTQIVLLKSGEQVVAVPAALMASVQRVPVEAVEAAYASGRLQHGGAELPFYWLGGLLGQAGRGHVNGRHAPVVLVRSAQAALALHVDEVVGNQEVVVKNLGAQLNRVPGLAGISLLASGEVALIYNVVALADWYGADARARMAAAQALAGAQGPAEAAPAGADAAQAPLVLVVDDSLTVRRVTQRLLERVGYRVALAKDGLDAMERLTGDELPAVVLSDIEMPRMDGFDLVRNMRADARLARLPVIMITSRIAQKHRDYAARLGVDHYLGKPYDEEQVLGLVRQYAQAAAG